jgi:hypothetical protein
LIGGDEAVVTDGADEPNNWCDCCHESWCG